MPRTRNHIALGSGVAALAACGLFLTAAPAMAATDTGGSLTITIGSTFAAGAAKAKIGVIPVSPATASTSGGVTTVTLPVTGGDANVVLLGGTLQLGGSLKVTDAKTGKCVTFSGLSLSYDTGVLSGVPSTGTRPVALTDIGGTLDYSAVTGSQTLTASQLTVDADGATFLDKTLKTGFFTAGQNTGSLTTTYTVG